MSEWMQTAGWDVLGLVRCQSKLNSVRVKWLHTHWLSFWPWRTQPFRLWTQEGVYVNQWSKALCVAASTRAFTPRCTQTHAHFIPLDIQKSIKQMLRLADHLFTQYSHDGVWTHRRQQQSPFPTFPHTHVSHRERSAWREGDRDM